jgi:ABC-type glycerol-3-phosphate transport system permease component/peptidoglycan/LPS O-acetylase OafA/YrhL
MIQSLQPSRAERRRISFGSSGYWFIAPFFVLFVVFAMFGLGFSFFVSFHRWEPINGDGGFYFRGLRSYVSVLTDANFWGALGRSLWTGLPGIALQHLVALPLAFALHLVFRRALNSLGMLFFLPYLALPMAATSAMTLMYLFVAAPVNELLGLLHGWLEFIPPELPRYAAWDTLWSLWNRVGWNVLLYLMAFSAVPRSTLEAAQLDGAGFWRQLRAVAIPVARPMIFVAFSISLVAGLQSNVWRPAFGGDPSQALLPAYIYSTAFTYFNLDIASTMTWVFFFVMLGFVALAYALWGRNFTALEVSASLESDHAPLRLAPVTTVLIKIAVVLGALACVYPLLLVFFQATQSVWRDPYTLRVGDAAELNYQMLQETIPTFWRNLWNSLYVSTLASLGAAFVSALAGFAFAVLEFRWKRALFAVVMAAMVFPAMSNAIPYLIQMRIFDWLDTPRALWVPSCVSAIGVFLARQYALNALPKSLIEAARVDGAGDATIFWRIALPNMIPVISTIALLTFVTTWNHLESAQYVMRSEETKLVTTMLGGLLGPQARMAIDTSRFSSDALFSVVLMGSAIATVPLLLVYAITAGQLGRGLGFAGSNARRASILERLRAWWWARRDATLQPASGFGLDGADGVRAVACLLVVFSHLAQRLNKPEQLGIVQSVQTFFMNGGFGVSAFFVLSGMLLSYPFWKRYLEGSDAPNLLEYARRRFVRIAPGFYASLVVVFLIALVFDPDVQHKWIRLVSGLTFTSSFHYVTFFPVDLNGPLWSIGFEVFCYLLMPLFMIGLFHLARATSNRFTRVTTRATERTSTRTTPRGTIEITTRTVTRIRTRGSRETPRAGSMPLAVGYWLGVFALAVMAHFWIMQNLVPDSVERGWQYTIIGGAKFWMPHYNPVGLFGHYCIGVLAAGFIAWRQRRVRLGLVSRTRAFDGIVVVSSVVAFVLILVTAYTGEFSFSLGQQPYAFPVFAICVASILASAPFATWIHRPLDNAFFRYTARVSFGLYIWHYPILELTRLFHNPNYKYFGISSLTDWALVSAAILIVAYIVAGLSYTHIEAPFLKETGRAKPRASQGSVASSS